MKLKAKYNVLFRVLNNVYWSLPLIVIDQRSVIVLRLARHRAAMWSWDVLRGPSKANTHLLASVCGPRPLLRPLRILRRRIDAIEKNNKIVYLAPASPQIILITWLLINNKICAVISGFCICLPPHFCVLILLIKKGFPQENWNVYCFISL